MLRHNILCHDRVGQGQDFLCHDRVILCLDWVWPWVGFFFRNRVFYTVIEYDQMRGFVLRHSWPGWKHFMLRPSIFILRNSGPRELCGDRVFLCRDRV